MSTEPVPVGHANPQTDSFSAVGNVFYFVADLDAAVEWYAARLHRPPTIRGPKTVFTGERLCQLLDPFGNLFAVREEPSDGADEHR